MKYIMMKHVPREAWDAQYDGWSREDFTAHLAYWKRFMQELAAAGEWVDGVGLSPPAEAKQVRAGRNGVPVTDGPFPEAKEFLAGYWIVDVGSPERAYQIAAMASAAPGRGGAPLNTPIEVRQVMSGPPQEA